MRVCVCVCVCVFDKELFMPWALPVRDTVLTLWLVESVLDTAGKEYLQTTLGTEKHTDIWEQVSAKVFFVKLEYVGKNEQVNFVK